MGVRRQRPNKENSAVCGPFSSSEGGVSDNRTAWLTWEDSNFHTPISKSAFEMSAEFPLFWPKTRLGDFCSCELWKWADAETVKTSECFTSTTHQRGEIETCLRPFGAFCFRPVFSAIEAANPLA